MRHQLIIRCDISAETLECFANSGAFQIVQLVKGYGILSAVNGLHVLNPGDVWFTSPEAHRFGSVAANATVNYLVIWPEYLSKTPHITKLLLDHPAFSGRQVFTAMSARRSAVISTLFHVICNESKSIYDDKEVAILIYIQLMLLHLQRYTVRA